MLHKGCIFYKMYKIFLVVILCKHDLICAYLNTDQIAENQLQKCVNYVVQQVFKKNETLIHLDDAMHNFFDTTKNPHIIANLQSNITMFHNYMHNTQNFIIHMGQNSINKLFEYLFDSALWNLIYSMEATYIITTTMQHVNTLYIKFWKLGVSNLIVISYKNEMESSTMRVITSDPQAYENNCGKEFVIAVEQSCSSTTPIHIQKTMRKYTRCHITYVTTVKDKLKIFKSQVIPFILNTTAIFLNATFSVRKGTFPIDSFSFVQNVFRNTLGLLATSAVIHDDFVWVVPTPKQISSMKVLKIIFKNDVWVTILFSYFFTSTVWWLIFKFFDNHYEFSSALLKFCSLTLFGSMQQAPSILTLRLIFIIYIFYSIIIQTAFTSNLSKILTVPQYESAIGTVQELSDSNVTIIILEDFYNTYFVNERVDDTLYTKLKSKMTIISLEDFNKVLLYETTNHDFAYLCEKELIEMLPKHFKIYKIDDNTLTGNIDIVLVANYGSNFVKPVNKIINMLYESGLHANFLKNVGERRTQYASVGSQEIAVYYKVVLTLKHLISVFALWITGCSFSFIMLFAEHIVFSAKKYYTFNALFNIIYSAEATYVIITPIQKVDIFFLLFWELGVTNIVVISYKNNTDSDTIRIVTSDPQSYANNCGNKFVTANEQSCNSSKPLEIPKILRKYTKCNITYVTETVDSVGLLQSQVIRFILNTTAAFFNASFSTKRGISPIDNFSFIQNVLYKTNGLLRTSIVQREDYTWVVPVPKLIPPIAVLKTVFKINTWIVILFSYFFTSIAWWLVVKLSNNQSEFSIVLLNIYSLTLFGSMQQIPSIFALKFIFMFYVIYSVIMQTAFTSNLSKILTVPRYEPSIRTIEELSDSNVTILMMEDYYWDFFAKEKNDSIYTKLKNKMKVLSLENFTQSALSKTLHRDFAFLLQKESLLFFQAYTNEKIHNIEDNTLTGSDKTVLITNFGSYFIKPINKVIDLLYESGLHYNFLKNIEEKQKPYLSYREPVHEKIVLTTQHLVFVFVFWIFGILTSVVTFIAEKIVYFLKVRIFLQKS
ncbi:hypothetical protein FQR65_LT13699 [Abscondita terminalis]|nr:hypothetical protein FQR65_LT13699 [Abscondita terminalis]